MFSKHPLEMYNRSSAQAALLTAPTPSLEQIAAFFGCGRAHMYTRSVAMAGAAPDFHHVA
jgi:hypothetical protein